MGKPRIVAEFAATRWLRRWRDRDALEAHQQRLLRRQIRFWRRHSRRFADVPADASAVAGSPEHAALFGLPQLPPTVPTARRCGATAPSCAKAAGGRTGCAGCSPSAARWMPLFNPWR